MKTLKMLPIILLICILIMGGAVSNTAEASTVTVVNRSGQTIVATYYRPTNSSQWYNANTGRIYHGDYHYLTINVDYRYIDLSFKMADGTYQNRSGIDTYHDFTLYVGR